MRRKNLCANTGEEEIMKYVYQMQNLAVQTYWSTKYLARDVYLRRVEIRLEVLALNTKRDHQV